MGSCSVHVLRPENKTEENPSHINYLEQRDSLWSCSQAPWLVTWQRCICILMLVFIYSGISLNHCFLALEPEKHGFNHRVINWLTQKEWTALRENLQPSRRCSIISWLLTSHTDSSWRNRDSEHDELFSFSSNALLSHTTCKIAKLTFPTALLFSPINAKLLIKLQCRGQLTYDMMCWRYATN